MQKKHFLCICLVAFICLSIVSTGCMATKKPLEKPIKKPMQTISIPKSLEKIETNSEDIIDDIAKNDWAKANNKLSSLEKEWSNYQPEAKAARASQKQINNFSNDLKTLKRDVRTKKQYEAALSANKLTLDAIGFMELYRPKVPTTVGKLDYYGRQVKLTSEHGDWAQAKAAS